jgi:mannobiose 2-epimerase
MDAIKNNQLAYLENWANMQLEKVILPFWRNYAVDKENGGFYGQINNDLSIVREAEKGQVLNARILWTFSAVYRKYGKELDLELAYRAYQYIDSFFHDDLYGGYYWSLNADGSPRDTKKQIYAQAFVIYALTEYYKITLNASVLKKAIDLFHLIEAHSFDKNKNGYIEARNREWNEMADIRLSEKDMNEKKSMNTHLHILEAYSNLYRVWKDEFLRNQLKNLIWLFINKIIDTNDFHQILFFDDDWNPRSSKISFGHDIETSWLLHEAAQISENSKLIEAITLLSIKMCNAVKNGISPKGALYYESDRRQKHYEHEIEWWAQAEGIVGFLNAYVLTKDQDYLNIVLGITHFIEDYVVDKNFGEWYFRVTKDGTPILSHEKAGFWKCPYHNTRTCLEILHRIDLLST